MIIVRATTTDSFVSSAIRFCTWSDYSHVEIMIPDKGYLGAHLHGGVMLRPFDYDPKCRYALFEADCPDDVRDRIIQLAESQIGKPYDKTAILGILFHRDWKEQDSWFCSELLEWCFDEANWALLDDAGRLNRITPRDIILSSRLRRIAA